MKSVQIFCFVLSLNGVLLMGCVPNDVPSCPDEVPSFSDDPEGRSQWHWPALGAPTARDGERGVIVAVIDNGFDTTHPDLMQQLWKNPDEIPHDGIDNDGNGYIDDVHGWDFLDEDGDVSVVAPEEVDSRQRSHGTSAAGVIGAATNNGIGVAGGCPSCELMLLRARDFRTVNTTIPLLSDAIHYATSHGARVISISDGRRPVDLDADELAEMEAAVVDAAALGVLVVVSAGNDSAATVRWPAAIDEAVAVASVDWQNRPSQFTNFGEEVDLAAPGECIYTTAFGGGYRYFSGTSASAPIVAALGALLFVKHPEWGPTEVIARMGETSHTPHFDDRPELSGLLGFGVVHFASALGEDE